MDPIFRRLGYYTPGGAKDNIILQNFGAKQGTARGGSKRGQQEGADTVSGRTVQVEFIMLVQLIKI